MNVISVLYLVCFAIIFILQSILSADDLQSIPTRQLQDQSIGKIKHKYLNQTFVIQ